jgi:hypothetical protein
MGTASMGFRTGALFLTRHLAYGRGEDTGDRARPNPLGVPGLRWQPKQPRGLAAAVEASRGGAAEAFEATRPPASPPLCLVGASGPEELLGVSCCSSALSSLPAGDRELAAGDEGGIISYQLNPFAAGVLYKGLGYPLRSDGSSTQLHFVLRPDLESPRQARSIELLGTTRVGR